MKLLYEKGEIKVRYYNPGNYFDEIHMISFCNKEIEEEKVKIVVGDARLKIYTVGRLTFFSLMRCRNLILNLVRKMQPDIIRAYDPSLRGALAVYLGKRLKIPTVISVHNHLDEQRKFDHRIILWLRIFLERYSLKNADKVICVSDYVKTYAHKYGANDVSVVYNRVNLEQFYPRQGKNPASKKRKLLLSVGRLDKQKYQECLLRAIVNLDVRLIMIGTGRLSKYLCKLVKKLKLEEKVIFIKSVPHSQIQNYYLSADIFVLSTNYEGFCIPIIEAMAASLPIIATDIPPISEILATTGILVKNKPEEFKRVTKMVIDNDELAVTLGTRALERSKIFDSLDLEKKEMDIYKTLY